MTTPHLTKFSNDPKLYRKGVRRRGAVLPLFAFLLPVLIILSVFAINVAYMQLTTTELKVATDAAARAGGRAWSEYQTVGEARVYARAAASANTIAGSPLILDLSDGVDDIEFGMSTRADNGYGRYIFEKKDTALVSAGVVEATSIRINGKRTAASQNGTVALIMGGVGDLSVFSPVATSICTQIDRDIALVLDRSGSMSLYEDEDAIFELIYHLYQNGDIDYDDYKDATRGYAGDYYARQYSIYDRYYNADVRAHLSGNMLEYALGENNYNFNYGNAPPHSRWDLLAQAVGAFLDVLELTDQEEQVSLATFNSYGQHVLYLDPSYDTIRQVAADIRPTGGTAVGRGMDSAMTSILDSRARPYAAKTLVVLTDGHSNTGTSPEIVAADIVSAHNVTIHTVTFTLGADQAAMETVAEVGGGKHYHANDGSTLIQTFEDIANNMPTIITK